MSSISLINRVKYNRFFYFLYSKLGSLLIAFFRLFVHPQDNLIVFASFGGRKYDDSPRAIFEKMVNDRRFDAYDLFWAFIEPDKFDIPRAKKIQIDTVEYYRLLLKARVWITNSGMTRGLNFFGRHSIQLNTWHGTPIKLMGSDFQISKGKNKRGRSPYADIMLAQGTYDVDIFSRVFGINRDNFRIIGLPRNDELFVNNNRDYQLIMKFKLGIPKEKKVILYAPTFREYNRDSQQNCILLPPIQLKKWETQLGKDYFLLFRAHYEVVRTMKITDSDFMRNVSTYPSLNDLILASDILISDYSSIFFDYSITGKPMLCFSYDYDTYSEKRGLYFDVRKELQCVSMDNEDDLLQAIKTLDIGKREEISIAFRDKYVQSYGNASAQTLNVLMATLDNNIN